MRHSLFLLAAAAVVSLGLGACSNDAGDDAGDGTSSGSSSGGSSGAVSQNDAGSSSGQATLTVVVGGTEYPLVLANLEKTTFKETSVVTLPTIWNAAGLTVAYTDFVFDFVGADDFRPSSRDKCKNVVFDGATFAKGYVEVESQRLTWEDDLGFSGCAFVSGLSRIEASPP